MFDCASLLHTVDSPLGRLDYASLSQQALMEMVIDEIANKEKICKYVREPKDIEEWLGVTIEDDKVTGIQWGKQDLRGVLRMEWLPLTVKILKADVNQLTGTINLSALPPAMERLDISGNEFFGSIDLHKLPERLEELDVSENQLSGSVDLTQLPGTLYHLHFDRNRFSGSLDFTSLPEKMKWSYFSGNSFSGTLDLSKLPSGTEDLDLTENDFFGEVFVNENFFEIVYVEDTKVVKRPLEVE